ncbi:hypothetical protein Tsubulata_000804 [Turnera subulata]|uniref:Uncharacterized protein n=1 Tax=Turnera subulata TaxID=218843 RepID=A0A9Q0G9B5_9ROSI|nr:hypothetical protein Tsubulata_000804 [Turnera subulata]
MSRVGGTGAGGKAGSNSGGNGVGEEDEDGDDDGDDDDSDDEHHKFLDALEKQLPQIVLGVFFSVLALALPKITLTPEDLLVLPTGPRQHSTEELDWTRLDSCFKVRPAPSQADEIDDWSKTKKSPTGNGFESSRRERGPGGSFFDSQSRADESDRWVANKPSDPPHSQGGAGDGNEEDGLAARGRRKVMMVVRVRGGALLARVNGGLVVAPVVSAVLDEGRRR